MHETGYLVRVRLGVRDADLVRVAAFERRIEGEAVFVFEASLEGRLEVEAGFVGETVVMEGRLEEVVAGDAWLVLAVVFPIVMVPEVFAGVDFMYAATALMSWALKLVVRGIPYTGSGIPRGVCTITPQRTSQVPV